MTPQHTPATLAATIFRTGFKTAGRKIRETKALPETCRQDKINKRWKIATYVIMRTFVWSLIVFLGSFIISEATGLVGRWTKTPLTPIAEWFEDSMLIIVFAPWVAAIALYFITYLVMALVGIDYGPKEIK